MARFRISEASRLLGISNDAMRRLAAKRRLLVRDTSGVQVVDGVKLAEVAKDRARESAASTGGEFAGNRMVGVVTDIRIDSVIAQVEMQCGPNRVVSLIGTAELADIGLEVGDRAVAVIKSTAVVVETPSDAR